MLVIGLLASGDYLHGRLVARGVRCRLRASSGPRGVMVIVTSSFVIDRFQFLSEVGVVLIALKLFRAGAEGGDKYRLVRVGRGQPVGLGIIGNHHSESAGRWIDKNRA